MASLRSIAMSTSAALLAMGLPSLLDAAPAAGAAGEALRVDDACGGGSDGSCAVNALQISSRDAKTTSPKQGKEPLASAMVAPETEEEAVQREWVFNTSTIWANWENPLGQPGIHVSDTPAWNGMFSLTSGMSCYFCYPWTSYLWPKVSFLTLELRRRVKAFPENPTPEQTTKLRKFTEVIGWMLCVTPLDPRKGNTRNGTDWGEPTSRYYRSLASLPSTSLELPKMDDWFKARKDELQCPDACTIFSVGMACDLGYLAEKLKGNMTGNDLCWDKVQYPWYAFAPIDHVPAWDKERPMITMDRETYYHPEYEACQEHPLTADTLDQYCPMHGKYPDGFWGQNWGTPPPRGSEEYNDVLQCQRKIGLPSPDLPLTREPGMHYAQDMGLLDP